MAPHHDVASTVPACLGAQSECSSRCAEEPLSMPPPQNASYCDVQRQRHRHACRSCWTGCTGNRRMWLPCRKLKATDAAFPAAALEEAGYGALWQGEARWNGVALLAGHHAGRAAADCRANGIRRVATWRQRCAASSWVPSTCPTATRSPGRVRLQAALDGAPDPACAQPGRAAAPALLLGDFNVIPTEADVYDPKAWRRDALFEVRDAFERLAQQLLITRRCTATPRSTPSGTISANMPSATVGCASIICC